MLVVRSHNGVLDRLSDERWDHITRCHPGMTNQRERTLETVVVGLPDVITFQGRTPEELERSFRESVDFYLEMCARDGAQPDRPFPGRRPFSGRFIVRLDSHTHQEIAASAASQRKSLNQWVVEAIEKALRQ